VRENALRDFFEHGCVRHREIEFLKLWKKRKALPSIAKRLA